MTALDYCTITCNGVGAIGVDWVDAGLDPDESIVYAFVDFAPRLPPGTVIWAPTLTPPRGIQIDKVRARFAPEDGILRTIQGEPTNEKQRVTVAVGSDPFTLNFSGQPTNSLAHAATAAQVDAALEALSNIGVNEVFVSGVNGGPYDVTFHGTLGYANVPVMTATGATVSTITEGTLDAGVKLIANTAVLDLEELIYDVTFEVPESDRTLNPFAFAAPTTADQTIDLASVTRLPGRTELGI